MSFKNHCQKVENYVWLKWKKQCGYRIVAIISPFQGEDTGSTPVTRSRRNNISIFISQINLSDYDFHIVSPLKNYFVIFTGYK